MLVYTKAIVRALLDTQSLFLSQSPILCRDRAFIRFLAAIKLYIHLTFLLTSNIPVLDSIQCFFFLFYTLMCTISGRLRTNLNDELSSILTCNNKTMKNKNKLVQKMY